MGKKKGKGKGCKCFVVLILILSIALIAVPAFARGSRTTVVEEKLDDPMGVGVDVKCFETSNEIVSIGVEARADLENDLQSAYVVVGVDLPKLLKAKQQ